MSDAVTIVRDFFARFGQSLEGDIATLRRYMTDNAYFHTGTTELTSLDAAVKYIGDAAALTA